MRGTQANTLLFSKEQDSVSSFTPDSIKTMEILFLLLGFLFFVKGCTGRTLYGEVGGTAVLQCNSTREDVQSLYLQGGKDFRKVISAYHKTKNLTGPSRPDTYLNHVDKTVTFRNLTVSDNGTYKCIISHGRPGGVTEDTTIDLIMTEPPPTPSIETQPLCNVTCTLKCTADTTDLGPVSYEWKKDEGEWTKGDKLKNISSSDTPEKFFCRLTRVRTSNNSLPMENPLYKPVPGCAGLTLYGEVGGTAIFPCNSTMENINFIYFQGGPDFSVFKIGYHKTKNLTEPKRLHTKLSLENKTVTFGNLTVLDEGTYKCIISHGDPSGITEDTTTTLILIKPPPTPSIKTQPLCDVTCALKCTADTTDLGPVSYEWKKDEGEWTEGDALKNISSSDTPEKFFCRLKTRVRTSNTSLPMENPLYKPPGCAGLTLYGEVGGTAVFQCHSTMENINFIYFQGGPDFSVFKIGYHKTKNLTGPKRLHTKLSLENKTVTFWNLTVLDEGSYKCLIGHGDPGGITEDTTTTLILIEPPPTPSIETQPLCDVTCALKCTADTTYLGPVSYEWKKDEGEWTEGDALKNISSSDTPEKFFCRLKTRVRTSNTSLPIVNPLYKPPGVGMIIGIIIAIICIALLAVIALVKWRPSHPLSMLILGNDFLRRRIFCNQQRPQSVPQADPVPATEEVAVCNQQRPQSAPQADPVPATEEVAEREIFVPQPPVAEDLEMETMNNTNSNENM
ncbi:uncharacterized protein LOC130380350 [Gadus chalcogrammus]|uniref:uncharacterized protein LOC130380350 n=1 Tax=Gadus chalcogrammus TaxID=1042646 RepID=UPI0024C3371A|nr:uncharacterized protein LOC130380350 [Gadus chalcogrammus]